MQRYFTANAIINIALIITALHFTFTVRYINFTNSVLLFKLLGKCNTQYTENTDVNKPDVKADLNVKLQDEISNTIAVALLH